MDKLNPIIEKIGLNEFNNIEPLKKLADKIGHGV